VKSRSLGIIFIAAVIVPSILLAVLSIRSAGREEAWMEKQMTVTLDAEVTHAAGLAGAEVGRVIDELRSGLDIPPQGDYGRILSRWKSGTTLVAVPFMLSPRYGILWPPSGAADPDQKRFLDENGSFLSDRTATTVLQNIVARYQDEILAETPAAREKAAAVTSAPPFRGQASRAEPNALATGGVAANTESQATMDREGSAQNAAPASSPAPAAAPAPEARQMAMDAFAQSPQIQTKVYDEARQKGDQLNARVVEPTSGAPEVQSFTAALPAATPSAVSGAQSGESAPGGSAAGATMDTNSIGAGAEAGKDRAAKPAPVMKRIVVPVPAPPAPQQQSQFVLTSQLLSQIASRGDSGLIPRFIGEKLVFLFWERQKDGRIAGCQVAADAFRARIAGVLTSTWSPVRILTLLDENGAPLAAPPDSAGRDWRRPFVAREIGESLPRWEAAAYLTRPDSIAAQARSSSLVIWIMVMILFVSVAGGGTMVLSSVYGEIRLAQQKATFVTNVSHELKTPLTSISLFVDLLRRKGPLPAEKKEQYLSLMASETERLTRLINNVLDFSRGREARRYSRMTIDASEVARQVVEGQRIRLESRGFTLLFEDHPALTARPRAVDPGAVSSARAVRADPEALKQVLLNLLSNAEKYSAERKEITVTVAGQSPDVLIMVRDRGIGVPEKDREKIFREFFRVDDSLSSGVQGTGLGLTIARRIARDHGGDITCAARDGGGTDFTVRLPAEGAAAGEA
jgi:signal transduction histidine kinase